MYFHDKPGWGIALRIVLVLLLIAGVAWIARTAFYKGIAAGSVKMGPGYMMSSDYDDEMEFHHMDDYKDYDVKPGEMFYHHPGTTGSFHGFSGPMGHHSGYSSQMNYYSRGSHGTVFFHMLFGILGFLLLGKLIFGFGSMGMFRYGPMGWGPGGRGYHGGPYRYHRCHCPECSGEGDEEQAAEKAPASKSKKKVA